MATEKLIRLTFKNPTLEKDEKVKKWLDDVSGRVNVEEFDKIAEDICIFGQCFFTNREGRVVRIRPEELYLQTPQPLEVGMRVKRRRLSNYLTEWYLDSIDHEKNSCVVQGISPRWETPLRVVITNINEVTEWTQN